MLKCSSDRWVCATPQLVGWYVDFAEAVRFFPDMHGVQFADFTYCFGTFLSESESQLHCLFERVAWIQLNHTPIY